ncbi:hypothetical protein BDZ45DRAFT_739798 [Acephala macrosclerotiorum]|nr:hypothetical protein BDZ45DRAFT_739798 [Acephala macrosclerotiorum]
MSPSKNSARLATAATTSTPSLAATAPPIPAAALVSYKSVWGEIDTYIKSKSRSEALILSCGEAEAFADFEKSCHGAFEIMIGDAIRSLEETPFYQYMTEDLRNCYIEESVWRKIGLSIQKKFPGNLGGLDAFFIWYSEEGQKLVREKTSSAAESKGKGKGKGKEVEKSEEKKDSEDNGSNATPKLDYGHEYPERYADGEDEDADGGVPLFWT